MTPQLSAILQRAASALALLGALVANTTWAETVVRVQPGDQAGTDAHLVAKP